MASHKKLMREIGERLRLARQNAGYITISDFTNKQNLPKSTYTQYEIGARSLHIELAIHFSTIFKTNLIWLLTGAGSIDLTDNDLINNQPEKISQDEFLEILSHKNHTTKANYKKLSDKKSNNYDVFLLSEILSKIIRSYQKQSATYDFKNISEITFGIYFDIINKTQDKQEQKNLIDVIISTFNRTIRLKQKAV